MLAAVSRETPENTRKSKSQNTLDPGTAQEYISQVSEEIERRVTKKISKDFSRTDSGFLGALSTLDEFLLNPQVRTCSVADPCLSRPKESSLLSPAVAPLLQDSSLSPHSPTLSSLASPISDAGRVEKACCPGSVTKLRCDHESKRRRPCDKYGNRNGWALSQYLWAQ